MFRTSHLPFFIPKRPVWLKFQAGRFFAFFIKITAFADHINITEAPVSVILLMDAGAFFVLKGVVSHEK